MLAILPLAALVILYRLCRASGEDWLRASLLALLLAAGLAAVGTEVLGVWGLVTSAGVAGWWALIAAVAAVLTLGRRAATRAGGGSSSLRARWRAQAAGERPLVLGGALVLAVLAAVAVCSKRQRASAIRWLAPS